MKTKSVERRGPRGYSGASKSSPKAPRVAARPRSEVENTNDPRGQFGSFLYDWIDRKLDGDESKLAAKLGIGERAIRKWMKGKSGPVFQDLDRVAKAMDFDDAACLLSAVKSFCKRRGI